MDGGITGGEESGELRAQVAEFYELTGKENISPTMETHLPDISNNLEGGTITNNQSIPPDEAAMYWNEGTSRKDQNTDRNNSFPDTSVRHNGQLSLIHMSGAPILQEGANQIQEMPMTMQQANDQTTRSQATESSAVEAQSSNFSFGIRGNSMNIIPNANPSVMQATTQGKTLEKAGLDQQQRNGRTSQNRQTQGKDVQAGHKNIERQKGQNKDANLQGGTVRTQPGNIRATIEYQTNFPRISNNFARYDSNLQRGKNVDNQISNNVAQVSVQPVNNQQQGRTQNSKQDVTPEPAPFTIVQSFAARLRYNQSKTETPIVLNSPIHTTRKGLPAVLLDEEDYNVMLAESCKHTLVGKFTNTMPKMELIRKSFTLQTQLTGGVKITHFNSRHVYIDLDNEFDYVTVWTRQRMNIEGQLMRIQTWTPDFTPEEETPIVPIWVALPELPWHCYNKVVLTTILSSIDKVLYLDSPSSVKTRGKDG
ncbi:hypothetical protein H5410_030595 [Solanum commersonii]|uniref:DUF4283 domain-containing protein n=1 Tax=Solanum commersonii TaxID=4109 RepID=A0A9J5YG53_SOLCO|nr:hypothetical protein H5410_030595 [Solanum commersonii]